MVGLDDAIKQSAKQLIGESLEKMSKETLESTFGRQIPRSYLDSTGKNLTKSGAEKFYRTSIRAMIREGGEDGPARAVEATAKALGVTPAEAAEIVVGNLGVTLTRQLADQAVQTSLKASGRTLKEIICSTPSAIRGFLRSTYDNAIRLGRDPKQALAQTRKLGRSISAERAKLTLGYGLGAGVLVTLGFGAWELGSSLFDRIGTGAEAEPQQEIDETVPDQPSAVIGQSLIGLSGMAIGAVALMGVLTMGGKKENAVAAAEDDEEDDGAGGFDQIDDSQIDKVIDSMRDEGMAIGPVQRTGLIEILTDAEKAEICDLARLFFEDNENEIREALAKRSKIKWFSWWQRRNPFLDETRYPRIRYGREPGGIKNITGRQHFTKCLQELINRMR